MRKKFSAFLAAAVVIEAGTLGGSIVVSRNVMGLEPATKSGVSAIGNITLKLGFSVAETDINARNMAVELLDNSGEIIGEIDIKQGVSTGEVGGYAYELSLNSEDGTLARTSADVDYLNLDIKGLPQGSYKLRLSGDQYTTYTTDEINIGSHNKVVTIFTNGNGFMLGDVTGDGKIGQDDLNAVISKLSQTSGIVGVDVNGDGVVDIMDLAIVHRNVNAEPAGISIANTTAILSAVVDAENITAEGFTTEGDISNMLTNSDDAVTFSSTSG